MWTGTAPLIKILKVDIVRPSFNLVRAQDPGYKILKQLAQQKNVALRALHKTALLAILRYLCGTGPCKDERPIENTMNILKPAQILTKSSGTLVLGQDMKNGDV